MKTLIGKRPAWVGKRRNKRETESAIERIMAHLQKNPTSPLPDNLRADLQTLVGRFAGLDSAAFRNAGMDVRLSPFLVRLLRLEERR